MKSVVFYSFGGVEVLQVVEIETPTIGDDEVLVRVRAAAVNPKDTFIRKGRFASLTGAAFPMQTGFDFSGEVAAVGGRVQGFHDGEHVFGMLDGWTGGTCAQYVAVKNHQLSPKPRNLSFEAAAALPLVSLTALQALRDEGYIQPHFQVCINGASGGVGSMAVQIAKRFDATITAVSSAQNHTLLKALGADHCIDYHQADVVHGGHRFDIFFDVFGNQLYDKVRSVLAPKGIWVSTVLRPEVGEAVERTKDSSGQKAKLVIVRSDRNDLAQVCRWAEAGLIKPVIHAVFTLADIAAAHRQQESKHTCGKLVITIP